MNSNSKKSRFGRKGIIIGILVLVILLLVIYLLVGSEEKEKVMNCSMTMNSENLFSLDMQMEVEYTDYVDFIKGKIYYKFLNNELKNNIDTLKDSLSNSFSGLNSIQVNVTKESDMLVIDYSIDYSTVNKKELEAFGFDFTDSDSLEITIEEFEKQILEGGGSCVEE